MKNSEEMVSSLLQRRKTFENEKAARRKGVRRFSGLACSLALVVFLGAGVSGGWWLTSEPELPTVTPTQTPLAPTQPTVVQTQTPEETTDTQPTVEQSQTQTETQDPEEIVLQPERAKASIAINWIEDTTNQLMYIALMTKDFVPMTEAELRDYYGTEFIPEVPEDLAAQRRESHMGIYRRDGGTGEVYHDEQRLTWVTEDETRGIAVTVRKDRLPYQFFALLTQEEMAASEICGVEVFVGRTAEGLWLAEFMHEDVGFRICAEGVTQEELVDVIESLLG